MERIVPIVLALLGYLFLIGWQPSGHGPEVDGSSEGSKAPAPEVRRCSLDEWPEWLRPKRRTEFLPIWGVADQVGPVPVVWFYGIEIDGSSEG